MDAKAAGLKLDKEDKERIEKGAEGLPRMKYPRKEEVLKEINAENHLQLQTWVRRLPLAETNEEHEIIDIISQFVIDWR